jgi:hypothetical protein
LFDASISHSASRSWRCALMTTPTDCDVGHALFLDSQGFEIGRSDEGCDGAWGCVQPGAGGAGCWCLRLGTLSAGAAGRLPD